MATRPGPTATSAAAITTTASPTKKPQPIPWTHQETINLIQAYQEKWYSLKRGQLRANQWEEVAVTVAARCGYDYNEPSKSAIQCRHKMEKLRQRYRSEKQRLATAAAAYSCSTSRGLCSSWQYYQLIDQLERGPLPISARPLASMGPCSYNTEDVDVNFDDQILNVVQDDDVDEDDEEEELEKDENYRKSRSINCILRERRANYMDSYGGGTERFLRERDPIDKKRSRSVKEEEVEYEQEVEKGVKGRQLISKLATEIKAFGERFIGLQNLQMEITKETERCRLEMENKRMEMILKSQETMVDSIERVFGCSNKMKMASDI